MSESLFEPDFELVVNPVAWTPEVAVAAGIGPAHPCHPYHRVFYEADGQHRQYVDQARFVHGYRDAETLFAYLGFPDLDLPQETNS